MVSFFVNYPGVFFFKIILVIVVGLTVVSHNLQPGAVYVPSVSNILSKYSFPDEGTSPYESSAKRNIATAISAPPIPAGF